MEFSQFGPQWARTHNEVIKEWAHSQQALLCKRVQDCTYNHSYHMAMECHLQAQGLKKKSKQSFMQKCKTIVLFHLILDHLFASRQW